MNNLQGVTLASQMIPANALTATPTLITFTFSNGPLLMAGSSYFVGASATGTTNDGWNSDLSSTNSPGEVRYNPNNAFSDASLDVAFQVNGTAVTAVPELGSVALLVGLSVTGASFVLRRGKRA